MKNVQDQAQKQVEAVSLQLTAKVLSTRGLLDHCTSPVSWLCILQTSALQAAEERQREERMRMEGELASLQQQLLIRMQELEAAQRNVTEVQDPKKHMN